MAPRAAATPTVEVLLDGDDLAAALRRDARRGLCDDPKWLPPKWFYDERGCELFEAITRLPEYYPTRRERAILSERAGEVASLTGADTIVELGAGSSEKTRLLLDAFAAGGDGPLRRFVPFDVAETALRAAAEALCEEYPGLEVHAVVGDFERHLGALGPAAGGGGPRLVAFLGGTIGNLEPAERAVFLGSVAAAMEPGDWLLLGTDLVKDADRLVRAYDDSAGVTAEFNRNVLRVLNRELAADFDVAQFGHVARWDAREEWMEMSLRSAADQRVRVGALGLTVEFRRGEELRTEISAKFRRPGVERELAAAGLALARWWTDHHGDFAVALAVKQ